MSTYLGLRRVLKDLAAILGSSGGRLGPILGPSWQHLGPSWGQLGASWRHPAEVQGYKKRDNLAKIRVFAYVDGLRAKIRISRHLGLSCVLSRPSLEPSWGQERPGSQEPRGTLQAPRKTAQKPPSSATANGFKALSCRIPSTAGASLATTLSVPLPGRFRPTFMEKLQKHM